MRREGKGEAVSTCLVHAWIRWTVEATDMSHTYSFGGYGGVSNCGICDVDTQVNEYTRGDGLVVFLCKPCEDKLHL